jgi:formylmethanofuran dehydrogenase subunit E
MKNETKIPDWARKLHDECCSWKDSCSDDKIEINPKCRECGEFENESVAHKGENVLCNKCWNKKLSRALS